MEPPNPNPRRFSPVATVSVAAMVLLMGAVFFTVTNVQQQQDNRSKASSNNLLSNPGCESSTSLFSGYQASLSVSSSNPHSGSTSCKVVSNGGSFYDIQSLQSYPNPKAGTVFTGYAWVRADSNTGGKVFLAMRESGGGNARTAYGPGITLTTQWQQISNTFTVQSSGRTSLDYYIVQDPGSSGQSFYVDDMIFQSGNAIVPTTAVPTTAPTLIPTLAPTATMIPPTATLIPTATKAPTPTLVGATAIPTAGLIATATPFPTSTPTPTSGPAQPTTVPTATPVPAAGSTLVNATLLLHGIGKGGDSVNPNGLGTANPLHTQRTITMDVYNSQNQLVVSQQGTVIFNPTAGNFSGTVNLGTNFASGVYTIKIKSDQYLRGLVSGIQTITAGTTNTLPSLTLIAGDVNGDNQINIVDYNLLVGCYSDLLPAVSCTASNKLMTDLTDDGNVNEFDYNFFIRELTNLGGQ